MSQVVQEISHELLTAPPPTTNRPENYLCLDAWRGIAALSVCFYHASRVIVDKQLNGYEPTFYAWCNYGSLGVQVFFVVSGYCIAASAVSILKKGRPLSQFVVARLKRIFPACWASLLLVVLMGWVAQFLVHHGVLHESATANAMSAHHDALFWISNLTLTQIWFHREFVSAVHWTLCYEIVFYMIIACAMAIAHIANRGKSIALMLWLLHGLTVVSLVGLIVQPLRVPFPFDLWAQFGFGVIAYDYLNHSVKRRAICAAIVASALTAFFISRGVVGLSLMRMDSQLIYLASLFVMVAAILLRPVDAPLSRNAVVGALRRVGTFSYSLYLVHFSVLGVTNQLVRTVVKTPSYHYLQMLFSIIVAVIAGWVFYLVAEKPFLAKSRR